KPASKIRAVMSTNGAYVTALGKPDIKTFADLAGKAAAPGRGGMTGRVTYQYVLNELGIKSKVKEINSGYAEMPSLFKDGIAQAVVVIGSIPHPVIDEILSTHQGNLLPIDGKVAKVLTEKYNYEAVTIPAGTFKGQKADVQTVGSVTTLCTHADVPEEWVYKLTKAAWEGRQRLIQAHKAYKELDKTMVTKGVRIPFHPGAARYWREVGILKS
ncbi:MAG: TAXI family TRAP transporter solute-binding subunit, partial [Hyphomicrobiaceae bacterium]